jgi:DnaJ-domain-containing protein 1
MSEPTKTISFRVSPEIDAQIEEIAKALGLTKSQWVRDLAMQAVHATNPPGEVESPAANNSLTPELVRGIEDRILEVASGLRDEILTIKASIEQVAKNHHNDLLTVAQVAAAAEESMEQRIENACLDVLDALERLKQSQRSHKHTVLQAIRQI